MAFCSNCTRHPATDSIGDPPRYPFSFFKCSSQRTSSCQLPPDSSASTARVTIVPGKLFFGVLGTTFAARNCRFPVLARSPNVSTVVSFPKNALAAACISSGIAGSAVFVSVCAFCEGEDDVPQPSPITRAMASEVAPATFQDQVFKGELASLPLVQDGRDSVS